MPEEKEFVDILTNTKWVDEIFLKARDLSVDEINVDFSLFHPQTKPSTFLPLRRVQSKQQQLESILCAIRCLPSIETPSRTIVDFCSGGGHVGIFIAAIFPQHSIILVEKNSRNCSIAKRRKSKANLTNVRVLHRYVEECGNLKFDIGVAVHACGWLTDYVQHLCSEQRAEFVLCSCCVGKLEQCPLAITETRVPFPRSAILVNAISRLQYLKLAAAADTGAWEDDRIQAGREQQLRYLCKYVIEMDRCRAASDLGYQVLYHRMPVTATPKRDIIIGYCTTKQ